MDHGGFSTDDTHIACLISVNGAKQTEVNETVYHTQVALEARPHRVLLSQRHLTGALRSYSVTDQLCVVHTCSARPAHVHNAQFPKVILTRACLPTAVVCIHKMHSCRSQLAPTVLTMLGMSPDVLDGVKAEGTAVRTQSRACMRSSLKPHDLPKSVKSLAASRRLHKALSPFHKPCLALRRRSLAFRRRATPLPLRSTSRRRLRLRLRQPLRRPGRPQRRRRLEQPRRQRRPQHLPRARARPQPRRRPRQEWHLCWDLCRWQWRCSACCSLRESRRRWWRGCIATGISHRKEAAWRRFGDQLMCARCKRPRVGITCYVC